MQAPGGGCTVELLTREVEFEDAEFLVGEFNVLLGRIMQMEAEYNTKIAPPPQATDEALQMAKVAVCKYAEVIDSMLHYALIQSPSPEEAIPRIEEVIVLYQAPIRCLDIAYRMSELKQKTSDPSSKMYYEYLVHLWCYKFFSYVFESHDADNALVQVFATELTIQNSFSKAHRLIEYLCKHFESPPQGYQIGTCRRVYNVFSKLLYCYIRLGNPIPKNLQLLFKELHQHEVVNYRIPKAEDPSFADEQQYLLIPDRRSEAGITLLKEVEKPLKKLVFLGMLVGSERDIIIQQIAKDSPPLLKKFVALSQQAIASPKVSDPLLKEFLRNSLKQMKEALPEEERPKEEPLMPSADPMAMPDDPEEDIMNIAYEQEAPPKAEEPVEIENLVFVNKLSELLDKGPQKKITFVQDPKVLEQLLYNWKIRGRLTFAELVELCRVPFQVTRLQTPGGRSGRLVLSLSHLLIFELPEDNLHNIFELLVISKQLTQEQSEQIKDMYPSIPERIPELQEFKHASWKLLGSGGRINIPGFQDAYADIEKELMQKYSHLASVTNYWNMVEELFNKVSRTIAGLATDKEASPQDIEKFTQARNKEFVSLYDKVIKMPEYRYLKAYFAKKYSEQLMNNFLNVKVKNDLIAMTKVTPISLSTH